MLDIIFVLSLSQIKIAQDPTQKESPFPFQSFSCLLQYMPGVGVPNFIELSEVREYYRYFFVLIRSLERTNGISSMAPKLPNPFACHVPTLAFAAVADDEQWMPRESMNSQTQNSEPSSENRTHQYSDRSSEERRRQSSEESGTNTSSEKGKQLASKSSVQLPHHIEVTKLNFAGVLQN